MELGFSNNVVYEGLLLKEAPEVGNPQPSLYVRHDKDRRKVQRLNGYGSEKSSPLL